MNRQAMAGGLLLLALLGGCGGSPAPAESAPQLTTLLGRVDGALASDHYATARRQLLALVQSTERARASGELADDEADRVLAAAARLLAELPQTTSTPPSASPSHDADRGPGEGNGKHKGKGEGEGEGKGKDGD